MKQSYALVFPGQGSQSVGMLADLADNHQEIQEIFERASSVLSYDLWQLVVNGPEDQLNQTEFTQAAMLTADYAIYFLLNKHYELAPKYLAGHSLGEYAALVAAGALTFEDAVKLVSIRGKIMQEFIPLGVGAMAAIVGLDDETVESICHQASDDDYDVAAANYNAIGQVVIAGHKKAVEKAINLAQEANARLARMIPVSVPCHCRLLTDASEQFYDALKTTNFVKPTHAVISNVDLSVHQNPESIRKLLKEQLYKPVLWVGTIQKMKENKIDLIFELGPSKVLSGLIKRIDKTINAKSVNDVLSLNKTLDFFKGN